MAWLRNECEYLREYFSLLGNGRFSLFLLSTGLLYVFLDVPYVNLPEYVSAKLGVSERDTSLLVRRISNENRFTENSSYETERDEIAS